jgi:hypothetical protein
MANLGKRFQAEQIIHILREIDLMMANGKGIAEACKKTGISDKSYYCWFKIYGGLKLEQAKRF